MSKPGTLYLFPVTLGETEIDQVIPVFNRKLLPTIKVFVVENIKTARRFLRKAVPAISIDDITFYELNKRTTPEERSAFLTPLLAGKDMGILSESGCPAIADPGAQMVELAHKKNIKVVPLVGPSSILLALMASGFNGQNFSFNGYLPKERKERIKKIRLLEQLISKHHQTQLFIETPYRNHNMLEDILENCRDTTHLCIAVDITLPTEQIITKTIRDWKKTEINLHKRPCLFLLN